MAESDANDRLAYSIPEVAKMLGISRTMVWKYVSNGTIPSFSLGGVGAKRYRVLVPRAALEEWLAERVRQGR